MKLVSNITCIFGIIAQIFLSSVVFAHDVSCQSSSSYSAIEESSKVDAEATQSCGCCHSHHGANKADDLKSDSSPEEAFTSDYPPGPCTCSSNPVSSYLAGEYSVETRERKISLIPFASHYDRFSFVILPDFPVLKIILNSSRETVGLRERDRRLRLEQYSGRFVSTQLSKFLL